MGPSYIYLKVVSSLVVTGTAPAADLHHSIPRNFSASFQLFAIVWVLEGLALVIG